MSLCSSYKGSSAVLLSPPPASASGVNQMFENGNTILHAACLSQNFDAALYLCTCGADTKLRNKNGHTADQLCFCPRIKKLLPHKYHGSGEAEALLEPVKKAPTLLEKQLIFESVDNVKEFDDLLMKLQTYIFDVNSESDENGDFLVHIAAAQGVSHVPLLILPLST